MSQADGILAAEEAGSESAVLPALPLPAVVSSPWARTHHAAELGQRGRGSRRTAGRQRAAPGLDRSCLCGSWGRCHNSSSCLPASRQGGGVGNKLPSSAVKFLSPGLFFLFPVFALFSTLDLSSRGLTEPLGLEVQTVSHSGIKHGCRQPAACPTSTSTTSAGQLRWAGVACCPADSWRSWSLPAEQAARSNPSVSKIKHSIRNDTAPQSPRGWAPNLGVTGQPEFWLLWFTCPEKVGECSICIFL